MAQAALMKSPVTRWLSHHNKIHTHNNHRKEWWNHHSHQGLLDEKWTHIWPHAKGSLSKVDNFQKLQIIKVSVEKKTCDECERKPLYFSKIKCWRANFFSFSVTLVCMIVWWRDFKGGRAGCILPFVLHHIWLKFFENMDSKQGKQMKPFCI